jgi:hypothetical protein
MVISVSFQEFAVCYVAAGGKLQGGNGIFCTERLKSSGIKLIF